MPNAEAENRGYWAFSTVSLHISMQAKDVENGVTSDWDVGLEDGSDLVLSAPAHASQLLIVVQQESLSAVPTGSGGLGASEQRVILLASSVSPNTFIAHAIH